MARANAPTTPRTTPSPTSPPRRKSPRCSASLLGAWAAVVWQQMGAPDTVRAGRAGPGRGTLMADALRAVRACRAGLSRGGRVHLIETSPRLRQAQAARCRRHLARRAGHVPPGPALVMANEFLDALPIRQFERHGGMAGRNGMCGTARFVDIACPAPPLAAAAGQRGGASAAAGAGLDARAGRPPGRARRRGADAGLRHARTPCLATACRRCATAAPPTRWPSPGTPT